MRHPADCPEHWLKFFADVFAVRAPAVRRPLILSGYDAETLNLNFLYRPRPQNDNRRLHERA